MLKAVPFIASIIIVLVLVIVLIIDSANKVLPKTGDCLTKRVK